MSLPIFIPSRQMSEECYDKVFLLRTIDFSPLSWMGVFHWLARYGRCLISAYSDPLKWAWISRLMWSCVIKKNKRWSCSLGSPDDRVEGGGADEVIVHRILITIAMEGMMEWICVDETLFMQCLVIQDLFSKATYSDSCFFYSVVHIMIELLPQGHLQARL